MIQGLVLYWITSLSKVARQSGMPWLILSHLFQRLLFIENLKALLLAIFRLFIFYFYIIIFNAGDIMIKTQRWDKLIESLWSKYAKVNSAIIGSFEIVFCKMAAILSLLQCFNAAACLGITTKMLSCGTSLNISCRGFVDRSFAK